MSRKVAKPAVQQARHFDHPTIGRFTRDEFGDYVRNVVAGGRRIPLLLNCAYEGDDRLPRNLKACAAIAARIYPDLERLLERSARMASVQCLPIVHQIRDYEGTRRLTSEELRKRLKVSGINVSPDDGVIHFLVNSYADEHSSACVRFGPRGGLREAYIE